MIRRSYALHLSKLKSTLDQEDFDKDTIEEEKKIDKLLEEKKIDNLANDPKTISLVGKKT